LIIFSTLEPANIFSLISHLSIKPRKAKRRTYKHNIRVHWEKYIEEADSWAASARFIFTIWAQFSIPVREKNIWTIYTCHHFPGSLNTIAGRVGLTGVEGEEIQCESQQTLPGCYWFVVGAVTFLRHNVCATADLC
jgi:hypothetical protein